MSLGDYLRLLRARKGGVTPLEIEAATGLAPGLYRYMEQRYRAVGDDDSIQVLADFYEVPFDDLRWRLDWPRKELNRALVAAARSKTPITLHLWNGRSLTGHVAWWDLGAVGLSIGSGSLSPTPEASPSGSGSLHVVQRHAVERWEPRAPVVDEDADESEDESED